MASHRGRDEDDARPAPELIRSASQLGRSRAAKFLPHRHRRSHHRLPIVGQLRRCRLRLHGGGGRRQRLDRRDIGGLRRRRPTRCGRWRCGGSRRRYCRYPGARGRLGRPDIRGSCVGRFRDFTRHLGVTRSKLRDAGFEFLDLSGHRGEILRHRLQLCRLRRRRRCRGCSSGGFLRGRRRRLRGGLLGRCSLIRCRGLNDRGSSRFGSGAFPRARGPRVRIPGPSSQPSPWPGRHNAARRLRRSRH